MAFQDPTTLSVEPVEMILNLRSLDHGSFVSPVMTSEDKLLRHLPIA